MKPSEVFAINQWDSNMKYDETQLQLQIELYRGIAQDECNNIFPDGLEPMGVKNFIAKSIKHNGIDSIQSKSMGTVSVSYKQDIPKDIMTCLDPYRCVRW